MRTVSLVTFASVFLCLLSGCAGAGDVGLRVSPADSDEAPAAVEGSGATSSQVEGAAGPEPPADAADAIPAPTAHPSGSPMSSPPRPQPTPRPVSPDELPAADEYTFDPSLWQANLAPLSSFRQKAVLDFTAAESGLRSKVTYEGEVTASPSALHSLVRVEGQGAAQLPTNQVEVIWIDDRAWVKVGLKPWVSVPATAVQSIYDGEVVGVPDLLPFVRRARRATPDETVNGVPCRHYVYALDNLQADVGMTAAQGDLWVAQDGSYVVRLTLEGQGTYYDTYSASGKLLLVYDLYDVDAPLAIAPPP